MRIIRILLNEVICMNKSDFEKQIEFILEIDKVKNILRRTHTTSGKNENDAEHSWHMSIMIFLLSEYSNEKFDVLKAIKMALIHDLVEIDAGDTYAYDSVNIATQSEREDKAAKRIFSMLPDKNKKEFTELFYEFEAKITPEAKFVRAIDNFQPILLNDFNKGNDWKINGVTKEQIYNRNKITSESTDVIWENIKEIIDENIKNGNIKE